MLTRQWLEPTPVDVPAALQTLLSEAAPPLIAQVLARRGLVMAIGGAFLVFSMMLFARFSAGKELFPRFMGIPGVLAFPVLPPSLGQSPRERPVNFVVVTSASFPELLDTTNKILAEVAKYPGMNNVDTDLKLNKPELSVTVNRDK